MLFQRLFSTLPVITNAAVVLEMLHAVWYYCYKLAYGIDCSSTTTIFNNVTVTIDVLVSYRLFFFMLLSVLAA